VKKRGGDKVFSGHCGFFVISYIYLIPPSPMLVKLLAEEEVKQASHCGPPRYVSG
jgi:hypothetical protein